MTLPTTIKNFPAARLEAARDALQKLQTRLVRAATRLGQEAPVAPVLTVTREFVISRCTECGCREEGWAGGRCMACKSGYLETRPFLDLALVVPSPFVAGWEFLAVIEPLDGGNLLRQVPGANVEGFDFSPWHTGSQKCDHCNTVRNRTETFLVRQLEGGAVKQVGRNCLADFLGGKSPEAILASLSFESIVRGCGDEDGEGGWGHGGEQVYSPTVLLAQTAASVRLAGWISRKAAGETGSQATADHVKYLFTRPFGTGVEKWLRDCVKFAVTAEDSEKAKGALEWASGLSGTSEYERNLALLAKQEYVKASHFGILCSAISGYERFLGTQRKKAAFDPTKSGFVGTVGEKLIVTVTVDAVFDVDTDYGTLHINKFRDIVGNSLLWKTTSKRYEPGKTVTLKGAVKRQEEYRGEKQTELTRCSEVPEGTVLKPVKAKKVKSPKVKPVETQWSRCDEHEFVGVESMDNLGCTECKKTASSERHEKAKLDNAAVAAYNGAK